MSLGPKEQYQVNKILERKSSLILEYKYIHFQKKKLLYLQLVTQSYLTAIKIINLRETDLKY